MESGGLRTVLVTGGTGFLGRNLVEFLQNHGIRVICLVRPGSKYEHLKSAGAKLVLGDFTSEEALQEAVEGVDAVFHLAACTTSVSFEKMLQVNCDFTENLVKVCAAQPKPPVFVYVSSLAATGPSTVQRPHEEADPCRPVSWYGKTKLEAERRLRTCAGRLPITVIRPPMLFGPHDHEVRKWLNAIRNTGIFFIPFLRTFRFSMAHSEDVCELLLLAAEKGERLPELANEETKKTDEKIISEVPANGGQGIYFVSQTEHPTFMEMGRLFGKALGRKFTLILPATPFVLWTICVGMEFRAKFTGKLSMLNYDKFREICAGSWSCSAEKARNQLGFRNHHSLLEQIQSTVLWLRNQEKNPRKS